MSIYNSYSKEVDECYKKNGYEINIAYDLEKDIVFFKNADPYLNNRLLVFEDDFNGSELNNDNWECEVGYVRGIHLHTSDDVLINNGKLLVKSTRSNRSTSGWTQGSIIGCGKKSWMYGRFEAKIRTDGKKGAFPAFWTVGDANPNTREIKTLEDGSTMEYPRQMDGDSWSVKWPMSGEIDIGEIYSDEDNLLKTGPSPNIWDYEGNPLGSLNPDDTIDVTKWHVYAMEWTEEGITAYIDDKFITQWVFSDYSDDEIQAYKSYPQSILLSQSSQGDYTGGTSDPSTTEHWMEVDWVRVYAPENVNTPIPVSSVSMPSTFELKKGYRKYMWPHILPINATNRDLFWLSSDESILKIEHGMMYGIEIGTATLIAISSNWKYAVCTVHVVNPT